MADNSAAGTYVVTVPGLLPLPNRTNAMSLRQRMASKGAWRRWTELALLAFGVPQFGRARVTFLRYSAGKPDTSDALPAAFKAVRDALVSSRVIDDDGDNFLQAHYEARRCVRREGHIELRIEPWRETPSAG